MPAPAVTIYTGSFCGHCTRALALLQRRGIEYTEVSVEDHPELRTELVAKSGRRTLPQIFVGERFVGGAEELATMDRNGELDHILQSEE